MSLPTVSVGQTQFDGRAAERYEGVVTSNVTVQPNAGDQAWLADDFSGQAINGTLTLDWVRPDFGGNAP